ncbi:hypothetical protein E1091_01500 [Micromonospora fluostatini]|uniref:Uncharacterized protein n=1 Tax=Micromonospora fluostatini TaxID=1629071 RepID=A0ABY2DLI2_9ACTN|nr:hypothetical protein E1091_01500 [Micromonospora fluostatini]
MTSPITSRAWARADRPQIVEGEEYLELYVNLQQAAGLAVLPDYRLAALFAVGSQVVTVPLASRRRTARMDAVDDLRDLVVQVGGKLDPAPELS